MDVITATVIIVGFACMSYIASMFIKNGKFNEMGFEITRWIKFWLKK